MTVADRVLAGLGPGIADRAGPLLQALIEGLTEGLDDVDALVSGQDGWAGAFDLTTTSAPAWLGQLAGVTAPSGSPEEQRDAVESRGPGRGTRAALLAAARSTLTGTRLLVFSERVGSAYHFEVGSYDAETANPAATEAAIRAATPAGLTFTYTTLPGQSWQDVALTGATWGDLLRQDLTWRDLLVTVPDPGSYTTWDALADGHDWADLTSYTWQQVLLLED